MAWESQKKVLIRYAPWCMEQAEGLGQGRWLCALSLVDLARPPAPAPRDSTLLGATAHRAGARARPPPCPCGLPIPRSWLW